MSGMLEREKTLRLLQDLSVEFLKRAGSAKMLTNPPPAEEAFYQCSEAVIEVINKLAGAPQA